MSCSQYGPFLFAPSTRNHQLIPWGTSEFTNSCWALAENVFRRLWMGLAAPFLSFDVPVTATQTPVFGKVRVTILVFFYQDCPEIMLVEASSFCWEKATVVPVVSLGVNLVRSVPDPDFGFEELLFVVSRGTLSLLLPHCLDWRHDLDLLWDAGRDAPVSCLVC